jgi:hypothetical protein
MSKIIPLILSLTVAVPASVLPMILISPKPSIIAGQEQPGAEEKEPETGTEEDIGEQPNPGTGSEGEPGTGTDEEEQGPGNDGNEGETEPEQEPETGDEGPVEPDPVAVTVVPLDMLDITTHTDDNLLHLNGIKSGADIPDTVTTLTVPKDVQFLGDKHTPVSLMYPAATFHNLKNYPNITTINFEEGSQLTTIAAGLSGDGRPNYSELAYIETFDMSNITTDFRIGNYPNVKQGADFTFTFTKIKDIVIPGNCTYIGSNTFVYARALESLTFAEGITDFESSGRIISSHNEQSPPPLKTITINRSFAEYGAYFICQLKPLQDVYLNVAPPDASKFDKN